MHWLIYVLDTQQNDLINMILLSICSFKVIVRRKIRYSRNIDPSIRSSAEEEVDDHIAGIKTNIFFSVASWAPKVSNSGAQPKS